MRDILVGIDDSDASLDALQWALNEAAVHGATVHALHVYNTPSPVVVAPDAPGLALLSLEDAEVSADALLAERLGTVRMLHGVSVEPRTDIGDPADLLIAASLDADLLVLGAHRHGALHDLVLGSVSRRCSQHAACPVVLVPNAPPRSVEDHAGHRGSRDAAPLLPLT